MVECYCVTMFNSCFLEQAQYILLVSEKILHRDAHVYFNPSIIITACPARGKGGVEPIPAEFFLVKSRLHPG